VTQERDSRARLPEPCGAITGAVRLDQVLPLHPFENLARPRTIIGRQPLRERPPNFGFAPASLKQRHQVVERRESRQFKRMQMRAPSPRDPERKLDSFERPRLAE